MSDSLPNLFIVGAPKCGTSALHHYLGQHPDIFMAGKKEVNFFGSDLTYENNPRSETHYLSNFSGQNSHTFRGEASVSYFYSKKAAEEIFAFNPASKIIIMLRDPVEMMYALHSEHVFTGNEEIEDFGKALAVEEERKAGSEIYGRATPRECVYYREIAKYAHHIERYYKHFGSGKVHVILLDDLKSNVTGTYKKVLEFLGVDTGHQPEFKVVNPNKQYRNKTLRNFLSRPPELVKSISRTLLPFRAFRRFLLDGLWRINRWEMQRKKLPPDLKMELQGEFRSEIEKVAKLIGRNLTHWSSHL